MSKEGGHRGFTFDGTWTGILGIKIGIACTGGCTLLNEDPAHLADCTDSVAVRAAFEIVAASV